MPTKCGSAAKAIFVSLVYSAAYFLAQMFFMALTGFVGMAGSGKGLYECFVENIFLSTLMAILGAIVLYIGFAVLRERPMSEDVRLTLPSPRSVFLGVGAALALRVATGAYTAVSVNVPVLSESLENAANLSAAYNSPLKLIIALFVISLAGPVFEEILFRGLIQGELLRSFSPVIAVAISSVIFSLAHGLLFQEIFTFFLGLALGFLALRTRSLIPSMSLHIAFNATASISLWFFGLPVALLWVIIAVSVLIAFVAISLA